MKFQVDILSGSKVTEGDGRTDHQTLRFLEIPAGSKNPGIFGKKSRKFKSPNDKNVFLFVWIIWFYFRKKSQNRGFWGFWGFFLKNPGILRDFLKSQKSKKNPNDKKLNNFFLDNFLLFQKNTKKSQNLHFFIF